MKAKNSFSSVFSSAGIFLMLNSVLFASTNFDDYSLFLTDNSYYFFSILFIIITTIIIIAGGVLKRKKIALKKSAILIKILSFLPLALVIYILANSGIGFFSFWKIFSSFASLLFSVYLFGTADILQVRK